MSHRGGLRTGRRASVTHWCACFLIALVLCPFTAPYASYDPNAAPVDLQDGSVLATHDKDVTVAATLVDPSSLIAVAEVEKVPGLVARVDAHRPRFVVLRI